MGVFSLLPTWTKLGSWAPAAPETRKSGQSAHVLLTRVVFVLLKLTDHWSRNHYMHNLILRVTYFCNCTRIKVLKEKLSLSYARVFPDVLGNDILNVRLRFIVNNVVGFVHKDFKIVLSISPRKNWLRFVTENFTIILGIVLMRAYLCCLFLLGYMRPQKERQ